MTAFNDAEIVKILGSKVVPVATHVRDTKRQDVDGEFFRSVCSHIRYWQSGACLFTPDGKVLGQCSATSKKEVLDLLESALAKFQPPNEPYIIEPLGKVDEKNRYVVEAPEGTVVVSTMMAHLSQRGSGRTPWFDKLLPETVAIDRLWILKDEAKALAAGTFPASLKSRIAQWHLVDSITFDQNRGGTIKQFDLELKNGRLTGSMHMASTKSHSMRLDILGFIESKGQQITRFDFVARGTRSADNGKPYPIAFAFSLADEQHIAFKVPPYPVLGYSPKVYLRN
ncbi:MAG: hypothetical protein O3A00_15045 [Planctomycetota bacterium]|nr:hypothetical protein [Planctomycetota bacterium]